MLLGLDAAASLFPSLLSGGTYGCRLWCNVAGNGCGFISPRNHHRNHSCFRKKNLLKIGRDRDRDRDRVVSAGASDSTEPSRYHPFEEIDDKPGNENPASSSCLSDAEIARTIVEVNNTASLIISLGNGEEDDDEFDFSGLPYSTDEHGDIYFEVNNDESLAEIADDKTVKVRIGMDSSQMVVDQEELNKSDDLDFDEDEFEDESDDDESDDEDYDDDDVDVEIIIVREDDDDENMDNWSEFDTVNSCHPLDFAKEITEAVNDEKIDWIDHPSSGVIIQGFLRPVNSDESTSPKRNVSSKKGANNDEYRNNKKDGAAFLKLELMNIQLNTANGNQSNIGVHEYWSAKPDVIAHSAQNIISRLKAGGDKITVALKSLCWRHISLQVEEACVIGVDSLGFDVKVCAAKQMQVLRFAFNKRATSEFGAEKQVHDLLFPKHQQEGMREQRAIGQ